MPVTLLGRLLHRHQTWPLTVGQSAGVDEEAEQCFASELLCLRR